MLERKNGDALLRNRSQRAKSFCPRSECFRRRWRSIEKDQGTDNQCNCRHNQGRYEHDFGPTGGSNWTDANGGRVFPFSSSEFLRDLRIAKTILVEVKQVQAQAVLDFAFTQIMQVRLPMPVFTQVLRYVRGQKNMPGIAAIQHSLRDIDP